jgi:hypothetical protein
VSAFRNNPIDQRYLSDQDKESYQKSGAAGSQMKAYKKARAWNGQEKYQANRQPRTVTQRPGTGGQSAGIGYQGQRTTEANASAKSARSFRPDLDTSIYDIYKG